MDCKITLRALTMEDFKFVLNWSMVDSFCSGNGWTKKEIVKNYIKSGARCVDNDVENFIR